MKPSKNLAFTLIELLVVISIIGILAALAIPAVAGALVKGQMTGTLNNARQLQLATFNVNLENEAAGQPGAWPSDDVGFSDWMTNLRYTLSEAEIRKMFAAPGVPVADLPTGADDTAFNVYLVGNSQESGYVFLSTRNWDAKTPGTAPDTDLLPYGDKGVVVMKKGGDGQVLQTRFVTNTNTLGYTAAEHPAKLE